MSSKRHVVLSRNAVPHEGAAGFGLHAQAVTGSFSGCTRASGERRLSAIEEGAFMDLTLNIIAHELKPFGRVFRFLSENPSFQSTRLVLEGRALASGILYVCQTLEEVRRVREAGCHAVFACAESCGEGDVGGAALVVVGGTSALAVFDALLETFSRFSQWTAAMDRICQTGGSIQQLIDVSEPFLQNNVVVLDPALKLLGYTKGVPCDDPITMELIAHGYHTEDNIRKFKLHKRFKPWAEAKGFVVNDTHEICKYVTVVRSFTSRSTSSLIVVMMCNRADPEPYVLDAYEMFAERVGFYAIRDYPGDKPSGNVVDTFLKDLINGQIVGENAVSERCRFAGIPLEACFALYYIDAVESQVPSRRLLADVSRIVAPAKTILMDNDAVVVLSFTPSSKPIQPWSDSDDANTARSIDERLEKMIDRYELVCGKSTTFSRLPQTPIAYEQAQQACKFGLGFMVKGGRGAVGRGGLPASMCLPAPSDTSERIFRFDDLNVAYLASLLSQEQARVLNMTRAGALLSAIAHADEQSNTDNYEFLRAYLMYERRTSTVAERLHMHRNNVNYRIGRIEEQFGLNTDDPALRIQLLLAYQLRDAFRDLA